MKKLFVKKDVPCMACLECVRACSTAFYKEFHQDKACLKIVERNGKVRPMTCVQCGKCAAACEHGAITQNPKTGVYMVNKKLCVGCGKCARLCPVGCIEVKARDEACCRCARRLEVHRLRDLCQGLPDGGPRDPRELISDIRSYRLISKNCHARKTAWQFFVLSPGNMVENPGPI